MLLFFNTASRDKFSSIFVFHENVDLVKNDDSAWTVCDKTIIRVHSIVNRSSHVKK